MQCMAPGCTKPPAGGQFRRKVCSAACLAAASDAGTVSTGTCGRHGLYLMPATGSCFRCLAAGYDAKKRTAKARKGRADMEGFTGQGP